MDDLPIVLKKRVLVLLSGGIDSAVCATKLHSDGNDVYALSIQYPNNANAQEISNAVFLAKKLNMRHFVVDFKFIEQIMLGVEGNMSFNVGGSVNNCVSRGKTSVPMSVELLHVMALMFARMRGIGHIYWAIHKDDLLDGSVEEVLEYLGTLERLSVPGVYSPCKFEVPFIGYSKKEMIELGASLNVDFERTHSCSASSRNACGVCRQCMLRVGAFDSLYPQKLAVGM